MSRARTDVSARRSSSPGTRSPATRPGWSGRHPRPSARPTQRRRRRGPGGRRGAGRPGAGPRRAPQRLLRAVLRPSLMARGQRRARLAGRLRAAARADARAGSEAARLHRQRDRRAARRGRADRPLGGIEDLREGACAPPSGRLPGRPAARHAPGTGGHRARPRGRGRDAHAGPDGGAAARGGVGRAGVRGAAQDPLGGQARGGVELLADVGATRRCCPSSSSCAESSRAATTTPTCTCTRSRCWSDGRAHARAPRPATSALPAQRRRRARPAGSPARASPSRSGPCWEMGPQLRSRLAAVLAEPLADELTRGQALASGALLHDAAKPGTRGTSADGARVTFIGHDVGGSGAGPRGAGRLRASERLRVLRGGAGAEPPAPRLPGPRAPAAGAAQRVRLPACVLARRGRRHPAVDSRPAGDAWRPRRGGDRSARAAGDRDAPGRLEWRDRARPAPCAATSSRGSSGSPRARASASCSRSCSRPATRGHHKPQRGGSVRARVARRGRVARRRDARPRLHLLQDRRRRTARRIVDEDERTIAFMDIAPATRGHALVIPREHSVDLLEVDPRGSGGHQRRGPAAGAARWASASAPTA